jgi:hypothetical protein
MRTVDNTRAAQTTKASSEADDKSRTTPESVYRSPLVVAVGSVREVTRGSAASGKADANSQYYW